MIFKKQIKITPKKVSRWLIIAIFSLTVVSLILVTVFLQNNFYKAITQSKEIMELKEKVALNMIDMGKFNSVIKKFTKKTAAKETINVASPFY